MFLGSLITNVRERKHILASIKPSPKWGLRVQMGPLFLGHGLHLRNLFVFVNQVVNFFYNGLIVGAFRDNWLSRG